MRNILGTEKCSKNGEKNGNIDNIGTLHICKAITSKGIIAKIQRGLIKYAYISLKFE